MDTRKAIDYIKGSLVGPFVKSYDYNVFDAASWLGEIREAAVQTLLPPAAPGSGLPPLDGPPSWRRWLRAQKRFSYDK